MGLGTFIRREIRRTFRVFTQTVVTPWISALLYIFIFGSVIGKRIDLIAGVSYIDFVLPGILMMNIIAGAFTASSSVLYFARFTHSVEEMLVAPFSHLEMIVAYTVSGITRAVIVGIGVYVIALFFSAATVAHFGLFLFYSVAVATIFSFLGLLVGLWAKNFEQLNILNTFVILPFSFLGGMFYSVTMLPEKLQFIVHLNPFFYFIDGIRYSMIGIREANTAVGVVLIIVLIVLLGWLTHHLFKIGWRLRA
ncbi:hypothetical protein A3D66_02500 [Candidatus Kaiserbacteria bacterium RIFCSPHIGHO2_02_FULL_50_9]|nr:MAG: hypothetical protein A2761_03185 [Candidatus Kaiserbacteria bacterium RIFCSPHIGHO2_01_FULL_51_33]OGG63814.1 MAG: hypothetical protein A3D66_02500 [Candidatus Kaiserbacteria bacterium RIFCSPHIGHO2_02_FULL_50_9]